MKDTIKPPKGRVYLAGPMKGLPQFNFPEFNEAAKRLRECRYEVWNPAEKDIELDGFDPATDTPRSISYYMTRDLPAVLQSDFVAALPDWRRSKGACLEIHVARECGIPVYEYWPLGDGFSLDPIGEAAVEAVDPLAPPIFPEDADARKRVPIYSGLLAYFPNACAAVAAHSHLGNEQHNPGQPMHWAKEKSVGNGDQIVRHLMEGHYAAMAWRALELLERQIRKMPPFDK